MRQVDPAAGVATMKGYGARLAVWGVHRDACVSPVELVVEADAEAVGLVDCGEYVCGNETGASRWIPKARDDHVSCPQMVHGERLEVIFSDVTPVEVLELPNAYVP